MLPFESDGNYLYRVDIFPRYLFPPKQTVKIVPFQNTMISSFALYNSCSSDAPLRMYTGAVFVVYQRRRMYANKQAFFLSASASQKSLPNVLSSGVFTL